MMWTIGYFLLAILIIGSMIVIYAALRISSDYDDMEGGRDE